MDDRARDRVELHSQWYDDSSYNRTGNILDIKAGIRYHF